MRHSTNLRNGLWLAIFTVMLAVALPATAMAQGRGRGWGQRPGSDKKSDKFVNGHDARDGRWDGRGPRQDVGVVRNRVYVPRRTIRQRVRDFNDNDRFNSRRLRYRNFDGYAMRQERLRLRDRELSRRALLHGRGHRRHIQ